MPCQKGDGEALLLLVKGHAEVLGNSKASIYGLRSTDKLPPVTWIGSRVYFQRADVDTWLREQRDERDITRPLARRSRAGPNRVHAPTLLGANQARLLRWLTPSPWRHLNTQDVRSVELAGMTYSSTGTANCQALPEIVVNG